MASEAPQRSSGQQVPEPQKTPPQPSVRNTEIVAGFIRVQEVHKSFRTICICLTIAFVAYNIRDALAELAKASGWIWFSVAAILFAGPAGMTWFVVKAFRDYIKRRNSRVIDLERTIDAQRTSSLLNTDGRTKDGL